MKDSYTREAVHTLKLKLAKIDRLTKRALFTPFFNRLNDKTKLERRKSFLIESQYAYKCFVKTREGEVLEKYHFSSNGSRKEFFKIVDNQYIRWCPDKKNITNLKKCKNIELAKIKGLTYGKVTSTFQKKKNKDLFPWLCMSIILENRSFDIYCTEENINTWYCGLAYAIKRHNPNAYVLSVGKFFWFKFCYLLHGYLYCNLKDDQKKKVETSKKGLKIGKTITWINKKNSAIFAPQPHLTR